MADKPTNEKKEFKPLKVFFPDLTTDRETKALVAKVLTNYISKDGKEEK